MSDCVFLNCLSQIWYCNLHSSTSSHFYKYYKHQFLALKYNDYDSLNWKGLIIRHEGEDAAFSKFFEYFHMMDKL